MYFRTSDFRFLVSISYFRFSFFFFPIFRFSFFRFRFFSFSFPIFRFSDSDKRQQTATDGYKRHMALLPFFGFTAKNGNVADVTHPATITWCRCRCRFFRCRVPLVADAAFRHRFRQRHPAPLEMGEPYCGEREREREIEGEREIESSGEIEFR